MASMAATAPNTTCESVTIGNLQAVVKAGEYHQYG